MVKAFPELTIVKGHVETLEWGRRGHMWLRMADGTIVDPTASQFPGILEYDEWKPGDEVRVGACMNCGEDIWRSVQTLDTEPYNPMVCSEECSVELEREFNGA
jgi:hypothetical protein